MQRISVESLLHLAASVLLIACSTGAQQSPAGDGCKLPQKIVDETHDDATRAWHVDDAYFEDHDLQDVVDCASDGDTIRLNVSRPVQPRRQIEISKRLEIRGPRRDEEKSTRQARAKPTLTCPPNDPLFVIRDVDVVLENVSVRGCVFTDPFYHLSVVEISCDRSREGDIVLEMRGVDFSHNMNPGGIAGFRAQDPSCVKVKLRDFDFHGNTYFLGSIFGHKNDLENIVISENTQWSKTFTDSRTFYDRVSAIIYMHRNVDLPIWTKSFPEGYTEMHGLENAAFRFPEASTSTVKDLVSVDNAGYPVSVDRGSLSISGNSRFANNTGNAGAVIVASESKVALTGAQFEYNVYYNSGGCLDLRNGSSGEINSARFFKNVARDGTCIRATSSAHLEIRDSVFEENHSVDRGCIWVNGSIDSTSAVTLSNCVFVNNTALADARAGIVRGSVMFEHFDHGRVLINSTSFESHEFGSCSNKEDDHVGLINMANTRSVSFKAINSSFARAPGVRGAGPLGSAFRFMDVTGVLEIARSRFENLFGCGHGGGIFLRNNPSHDARTVLNVTESNFSSIVAFGGTVYAMGLEIEVEVRGSRFERNSAQGENPYGHLAGTVLFVEDIKALKMTNCTAMHNFVDNRAVQPASGSVHIQRTNEVKIEDSVFAANSVGIGRRQTGGAIYLSTGGKQGELDVVNCRFEDNVASSGGAIYVRGLTRLNVRDCVFRNNSAVESGGAILASDFMMATFTKISFEANEARLGGALAFCGDKGPTVEGSSFVRNKAQKGGGIAYVDNHPPTSRNFGPTFQPKMSSSRFVENEAAIGGAIFFDASVPEISAEKDQSGANPFTESASRLTFRRNRASVAGGAVFALDPHRVEVLAPKCRSFVEDSHTQNFTITSFAKSAVCRAMKGNTVGEGGYGPDIATPAVGYYVTLHYKNGTRVPLEQGDEYDLGRWKSGDDLPAIEVSMYDHYGQSPARRGSRDAKVQLGDLEDVHLPDYLSYARAVMVSADDLLPNDLVGNLTSGRDNITICPPLVTPDNYTAALIVPDLNEEHVTLSVNIRPCVINEVPRDDNRGCIECKPGRYNFDPETGTCTVCPENGDCSGKYALPKSGHWNAFPCSHHMQKCVFGEACRGLNASELNRTVAVDAAEGCDFSDEETEQYQADLCEDGYEGPLCGSCAEGHGKLGAFRCLVCGSNASAVFAVLAAFFVLTMLSMLQIRGNLTLANHPQSRRSRSRFVLSWKRLPVPLAAYISSKSVRLPEQERESEEQTEARQRGNEDCENKAKEESTKFVQVLKITINFVQVVATGIALDMAWSPAILRLFESWDWIGGAVSQASTFSFMCLLSKDGSAPRSVLQAALVTVIPLAVAFFICAFWVCSATKKDRPWNYLAKRFVLTVVSVLYVAYLPLFRTAINVFSCVDVYDSATLDGIDTSNSYWAEDTSVRCFADSHSTLVFAVAIPLIVFAILFPVFLGVILIIARKRGILDSPWIQETFGMQFKGFKEAYVFWDCIVLLRKALIAVIATFSHSLGANLQGHLLIALLLLVLFLHIMVSPFTAELEALNLLESASLFVSSCTVLCGLILDDEKTSDDSLRAFLVTVVLLLNIGLLLILFFFMMKHKIRAIRFFLLSADRESRTSTLISTITDYCTLRFRQFVDALWKKDRITQTVIHVQVRQETDPDQVELVDRSN